MQIKEFLRRLRFARWLPSRSLQTLSSLEAYARWADSYPPHAHNALMQVEHAAMLELMPPFTDKRVVDLASGTGRFGLLAWERGARSALALDNSPQMLALNPLTRRALATMDAIPLADNVADVVLCGLAVGHLPGLTGVMAEISRVLRRGGYALVSDFHPFLSLYGARRTLRAGNKVFAVEHHSHLYADYQQACHTANMEIEAVREPRLPQADDLPVALVLRIRKRRRSFAT